MIFSENRFPLFGIMRYRLKSEGLPEGSPSIVGPRSGINV
jgi:hypothetical protein